MGKNYKAILIDSGWVLNEPAAGHWFIPPDFFKYVNKETFNSIPRLKKRAAFCKALEYINEQKLILTEAEEFEHFIEFYRIFFQQLPELRLEIGKIDLVAKDLVYNNDKYVFYKDVKEIIPLLSVDYKLAVVSDAWPSLENVFKKAGLREYFSSFVISSKIGVVKPNKLMYETALKELCVQPDEALFIDDNIKNCDGADKLGISAFMLCRDYRLYIFNKIACKRYKVIRTLKEILKITTL